MVNNKKLLINYKRNGEKLISIQKYYKDFDKLHDEFFFCKDNAEIKEILTMHGIKSW